MRHHTVVSHHPRHNGLSKRLAHLRGSLSNTAGRIKGKTSHMLSKSLKNVTTKTKKLPKNIDRIVVKNRYQTIGAAMLTGLCIGYFIKK
jgi:ElaB/YqjD/DUF883 family membrane-anchored ribosome-binding protein